jgi:hypothetical protein
MEVLLAYLKVISHFRGGTGVYHKGASARIQMSELKLNLRLFV